MCLRRCVARGVGFELLETVCAAEEVVPLFVRYRTVPGAQLDPHAANRVREAVTASGVLLILRAAALGLLLFDVQASVLSLRSERSPVVIACRLKPSVSLAGPSGRRAARMAAPPESDTRKRIRWQRTVALLPVISFHTFGCSGGALSSAVIRKTITPNYRDPVPRSRRTTVSPGKRCASAVDPPRTIARPPKVLPDLTSRRARKERPPLGAASASVNPSSAVPGILRKKPQGPSIE